MSIYKGNKLIAGGPNRPDWAHYVAINPEAAYMDGYTAPSNGMIVGWFHCGIPGASIKMEINRQIIIARSRAEYNGGVLWDGNVQCPVNKGDLIKLISTPTISSKEIGGEVTFVPYKAQ